MVGGHTHFLRLDDRYLKGMVKRRTTFRAWIHEVLQSSLSHPNPCIFWRYYIKCTWNEFLPWKRIWSQLKWKWYCQYYKGVYCLNIVLMEKCFEKKSLLGFPYCCFLFIHLSIHAQFPNQLGKIDDNNNIIYLLKNNFCNITIIIQQHWVYRFLFTDSTRAY